jgi:ectoine hydroxylase-related dioxygenase (phytanoyl-CoA dioxygenase family)
MSDPVTYELGDITVHADLTVHGAGVNVTDRPRWAYFLGFCAEDARWTGAPTPNFDASEMTPFEPLTDLRFPVLA